MPLRLHLSEDKFQAIFGPIWTNLGQNWPNIYRNLVLPEGPAGPGVSSFGESSSGLERALTKVRVF